VVRGSRRTRLGCLLAAILATGGVCVFGVVGLRAADRPRQAQRLPDGSTLALLGVTYGSTQRFLTGSWWQKLLWPVVPPPLREKLDSVLEFTPSDAPPGSLTLWMQRQERGNVPPREQRLTTLDAHGCEMEIENQRGYSMDGPGSIYPEVWALDTFPRRERTLRVRVYHRDAQQFWARAAEFQIRNPPPEPHPVWNPSRLPRSQRDRDVTVTLTRFQTNVRRYGRTGPVPPGETPWTRCTFRITRGGKPVDLRPIANMRILDPAGNLRGGYAYDYGPKDRETVLDIRGALCSREAYKLRTELTAQSPLTPEERRTVRNIPVPAPDRMVPVNRQTTRGHVRVRLRAVIGPGTRLHRLSGPPHAGPLVRIDAPVDTRPFPRITLLEATDSRGRSVLDEAQAKFIVNDGPDGELYFGLKNLPGMKRVNLTFGIPRTYTVEFIAQPAPGPGTKVPAGNNGGVTHR
jgi:hypothetical protein